MAGIYIHIPFCKQACNYCDFHFSTNLSNREAMIAAIVTELQRETIYLQGQTIESIYFGGGTPSLLSEQELSDILNAVYQLFQVNPTAEITLEANPDDIHASKILAFKNLGINRLSIGIQSFNDENLKFMHRAHALITSALT